MVMAGMEMRRLGLVNKPAYVVPNHMLEQFSAELLQLYPQARVLVATRDATTPDARKHFVARCAMGEWDAVVITHSAFERIPVSVDSERAYIDGQIDELRQAIAASEAGSGLTVKRLEAAVARAEERQKRLLDARRDDGVSFEQTGIDYLFVDEAHAFKNLAISTHVEGVTGAGSQRASDLDLKLHVLRERNGARVATFATATFVANSIAEIYVMQRYLQPEALQAAGLAGFDAWAATFGRTVTALELAPDGGSYRLNSRFARFVNVPELLTMFGRVADVRTTSQLALPTPALVGDRADTVVVAPSPALTDYVAGLVERAEKIRSRAVTPAEDNMLKVSGDGRRAALDLRLVGVAPGRGDPDGNSDLAESKIATAAGRIAADLGGPSRGPLRRPRRRRAPQNGGSATGVLRPGHPGGALERLRRTQRRPRLSRPGRGGGAVHPRRQRRSGQSRPVRSRPGRARRGPGRLHREDGDRHQRPSPRRRPAPPRLPVAPRRYRATRRTHLAPGQPEPGRGGTPLRHRRQLRRLHVADRGAQGGLHPPGHPRGGHRPGGR